MRRRWRRLDEPGLEIFELDAIRDGYLAASTVVHAGEESFGLSYRWELDADRRTRRLDLRLEGITPRTLTIERKESCWQVDGNKAPGLAHCDEIDLSATPFCNSLAIWQLGGPGALTALYVHVPSLELSPSLQRYQHSGGNRWRYIDEGVAKGFEADLQTDNDGLVTTYEGLFECIG